MQLNIIKFVKQLFTKKSSGSVMSHKVRDYGNEPFFVKKADASKVAMDKYGFPKEFATGKE